MHVHDIYEKTEDERRLKLKSSQQEICGLTSKGGYHLVPLCIIHKRPPVRELGQYNISPTCCFEVVLELILL